MKTFTTAFCLFLCLCTAATQAQQQKISPTPLFSNYPSSISISAEQLSAAMNSKDGESISFIGSGKFSFTGTVISNRKKYNNLQTVMVRSSAFNNAIFQITMVTEKNNSIFKGRIIHPDAADGYELKFAEGSYGLQKFEMSRILETCDQH